MLTFSAAIFSHVTYVYSRKFVIISVPRKIKMAVPPQSIDPFNNPSGQGGTGGYPHGHQHGPGGLKVR